MTDLSFITVLLGLCAIVSSGCDQPAPLKPLISKLKEPGAQDREHPPWQ